jgi:hypothetical protein
MNDEGGRPDPPGRLAAYAVSFAGAFAVLAPLLAIGLRH